MTNEGVFIGPLNGMTIQDHDIPDDKHEGRVQMIGEPRDTIFRFEGVEYYGDGTLAIPFKTRVDCELYYFIFKADYYGTLTNRAENISSSDWSDHYYSTAWSYGIRCSPALTRRSAFFRAYNLELVGGY